MSDYTDAEMEDCYLCNGVGYAFYSSIGSFKECPLCKGTGRVPCVSLNGSWWSKKYWVKNKIMIEIWKCTKCGFEAVDMAFYRPNSEVGVCPKCNSTAIEVSEQAWIKQKK